MKNKLFPMLFMFLVLGRTTSLLFAQSTAFTYQGHLNDGVNPASGRYDLRFAVFDAASTGTLQGSVLTNSATALSNGLFTVTLDFGSQFSGANRWLEIGVRTNGNGTFITLTSRQALTPTPYAITAGSVVSGGLTAGTYGNAVTLNNGGNSFAGAFAGNGANVTDVNAATLNGVTSAGFWKVNGNIGADPANGLYLGTADNLPLEFKVNGQRGLRIEPHANNIPNVIGGYAGNVASNGVFGAFIGGGGSANSPNRVGGNFATVLGGAGNIARSDYSTTMGEGNTASGLFSTAMGQGNTASGYAANALGNSTVASGDYSTAMGDHTTASGVSSFAMGETCVASALTSTALGYHTTASGPGGTALGVFSQALHNSTFVWSDGSPTPAFTSSANNQFLVYASGGVGLGTTSPQSALHVKSPSIDCEVSIESGDVGGHRWTLQSSAPTGGAHLASSFQIIDRTLGASRLLIDAGGNVGIGTTGPTHLFQVGNAYCDGNTWSPASDRNLKAGFQPVDAQAMLAKVAAMPITSWHYTNDVATPHVGPMAQDFYAAFQVGADDKHITTTDESGVALAAIQGLNQKVESETAALRRENTELRSELSEIKRLLTKLSSSKN